MRVRIAVATADGESVVDGHFAHAPKFAIYDIEPGKGVRRVELRENPLGRIPDPDDPGAHHHHHHVEVEGVVLHGIEKYAYLRERVLSDADVVVAGGACMTSVQYFYSEGVKLVFTQPGTRADEVAKALESYEGDLPGLALYEQGSLKNLEEDEE